MEWHCPRAVLHTTAISLFRMRLFKVKVFIVIPATMTKEISLKCTIKWTAKELKYNYRKILI